MTLSGLTKNIYLRNAFTMVETLVAIAVIGLLVLLLIPAVQSARAASRRAHCSNNLHQVGIAINTYLTRENIYPMSGLSGFSAQSMFMSDLEQSGLLHAFNFSSPASKARASPNYTACVTVISTFLCPADNAPSGLVGATNYPVNQGVGFDQNDAKNNGPFSSSNTGKPIGVPDITDGTTQTSAMAEWLLGPEVGSRDPRRAVFDTATRLVAPSEFLQFLSACHNIDVAHAKLNGSIKGESWARDGLGLSAYNHNLSIGDHTCTNASVVPQGAWTAGSQHRDGANVLFLDGHSSFIKESIHVATWQALGSMNGGEIIGGQY